MINIEALFKISYGLYIVASGNKTRGNAFISNTVFQVTSEPARFAACCNKNNYTCEFMEHSGYFTVSVLSQDASPDIFGRLGYKSGRDFNKLEGLKLLYGLTGAPVILNDCTAYLEFKVVQKIDMGTHYMFVGDLLDAQVLDESVEVMTYSHYRKVRKGTAPKNAPTYIDKSKFVTAPKKSGIFKCTACGHIYDESKEAVKFADLPSDWKCPECGADKEDFIEI